MKKKQKTQIFRNKSIKKFVVAGMLAVASYGVGDAQVLVGYNFTGLTGTSNAGANYPQSGIGGAEATAAANLNDSSAFASGLVNASVFSRGSNETPNVQYSAPNNYVPTYNAYFTNNTFGAGAGNNNWGGTVSNAIATGTYAQFTVSALSGTLLNLNSLTFSAGDQSGNVLNLGLAYSTDGGSTFTIISGANADGSLPIADYTTLVPTVPSTGPYGGNDSGPTNNTPNTVTVDLTGIASLQGASSAVFDLVYLESNGYDSDDFGLGNSAQDPATDDVFLNGTAVSAVPEPSTYALLSAGLLSLFLLNRRKLLGLG